MFVCGLYAGCVMRDVRGMFEWYGMRGVRYIGETVCEVRGDMRRQRAR